MKGRWDIYYVERPRTDKSIIGRDLDVAYLIAIKELHPDAWDELMAIIDDVNKKYDAYERTMETIEE